MTMARWERTIVNGVGDVQPAASVLVQREAPGLPLVSLYSDREGTTPIGNPFNADGNGVAAFHAVGGAYRITISKGTFSQVLRYVAVGLSAEGDGAFFNVLGELDDDGDLPSTGRPGTAYWIDGELWVWASEDEAWINLGYLSSPRAEPKRLVIFGSSGGAGWGASSYASSWAGMLQAALEGAGWTVENRSIPGDSSLALINRFYADVAQLKPDVVLICNGLPNDGFPGGGDSALLTYKTNVLRLCRMCRQIGAEPVLAGILPNDGYDADDYNAVTDLLAQLERWLPVLDSWTPIVDPADGGFIDAGLQTDGTHMADAGHLAAFRAIPLSLFASLLTRRWNTIGTTPSRALQWTGSSGASSPIKVVPTTPLRSFSAASRCKGAGTNGRAVISATKDGNHFRVRNFPTYFEVVDSNGTTLITSTLAAADTSWHDHVVTYNDVTGMAAYYIDGVLVGSAALGVLDEDISDINFLSSVSGGSMATAWHIRDPAIWRSVLSPDDVRAYSSGLIRRTGLIFYSDLLDRPRRRVCNLAPTAEEGTVVSDSFVAV